MRKIIVYKSEFKDLLQILILYCPSVLFMVNSAEIVFRVIIFGGIMTFVKITSEWNLCGIVWNVSIFSSFDVLSFNF